jgi:hypothetical protein
MAKWIAILLLSGVATAASLDDNGNLLLSRDEVAQTQAMFNELTRQVHYQRMRIEELEKALINVEKNKCS